MDEVGQRVRFADKHDVAAQAVSLHCNREQGGKTSEYWEDTGLSGREERKGKERKGVG